MERLKDIKLLDNTNWTITDNHNSRYHYYYLTNKKDNYSYTFYNIVGIEQLDENEFLICECLCNNIYIIKRCILKDNAISVTYLKDCNNYYFINNDNILFTRNINSKKNSVDGIYSIKDDIELDDYSWLNKKRKIDIENSNILLFEDMILANNEDYKIDFALDQSLNFCSYCYSSLRDSFVKINNKEEYLKFIDEEKDYAYLIDEIIYETNKNNIVNARKKLIKKLEN